MRTSKTKITGFMLLSALAAVIAFKVMFFGPFEAREPEAPPVPVLENTATIGSLDELALVRYYSIEDYPDEAPVSIGDEAVYNGEVYILDYIREDPAATTEGDCWETVYKRKQ